MMQPSDSLG